MMPPRTGPAARPIPDAPAHTPSARRRSPGSGNVCAMSASEHGINAAAPAPWTTRATISTAKEVAPAQATLPTAKTARPTRNPVRSPRRSASAPAVSRSAANARV
jgi:hypothetical protein